VPGVSPTNVASTQLFAETSAVPGGGLSVGSQRNFSNNFIVDGLSANDDAAGLSGIPYGVDAVDQFQVRHLRRSSGARARASAANVNAVTKSGTNVLHADLYEYVRDKHFNAANALTGTTLPMHRISMARASAVPSSGIGPSILRMSSKRGLDQAGLVTISSANLNTINARLAVVVIRERQSSPARIPIRSTAPTCSRRWIIRSAAAISSRFATASTTSRRTTLAARED